MNPEPEDLPEAVLCILLEVGSSSEHGSLEGRLHVALPLEGDRVPACGCPSDVQSERRKVWD